jgi:hypothetical protein
VGGITAIASAVEQDILLVVKIEYSGTNQATMTGEFRSGKRKVRMSKPSCYVNVSAGCRMCRSAAQYGHRDSLTRRRTGAAYSGHIMPHKGGSIRPQNGAEDVHATETDRRARAGHGKRRSVTAA